MKKKLFLFLFAMVSSLGFSQIVLRTDVSLPGFLSLKSHDSLLPENKDFNMNLVVFTPEIIDFSVLWEFYSHAKKDLHWFIGLDGGYSVEGFPLNIDGGLNFKIAESSKLRTELQCELKVGPMFIIDKGTLLYNEFSLSFNFMNPERKHFVGSIGLCDAMYYYVEFYKVREPRYVLTNWCGLQFSCGYRF